MSMRLFKNRFDKIISQPINFGDRLGERPPVIALVSGTNLCERLGCEIVKPKQFVFGKQNETFNHGPQLADIARPERVFKALSQRRGELALTAVFQIELREEVINQSIDVVTSVRAKAAIEAVRHSGDSTNLLGIAFSRTA